MSRFPLFPLLLSFSTTLQSACLQDKCSVQPFKDNDAECMPDMTISPDLSVLPDGNNNPDMTKLASFGTTLPYQFTLTGSKKRVDSVGMIDIKNNYMGGNNQIGQVGLVISDDDNNGLSVILNAVGEMTSAPLMMMNIRALRSSKMTNMNHIGVASFSRAGVTYFANDTTGVDTLYFVPWLTDNHMPIPISGKKVAGPYFSLSSDVGGRIHAVIKANSSGADLLASRSFVFNGDNLIRQPQVDMGGISNANRYRVLVGNIDNSQEPELITWDAGGLDPVLFKYEQDGFVSHKFSAPIIGKCPNVICPVALGDLNQDGLSDLIVLNGANLNIYYGTGNIATPFLMPTPDIPAGQDVQAIAVSIPSGDDPPKLVWATVSFIQDSGKSTGTNTITINVLPIKK